MAGVPNNFNTVGEAIPTYQAIDAALGVGYATYYAVNGANGYFLTPLAADSDTSKTDYNLSAGATPTIRIDQDYDLKFNFPQVIEGKMVIQSSFNLSGTGTFGGGRTLYCKPHINVYKVNTAAAESLVISGAAAAYTTVTTAVSKSVRSCIDLEVPKTPISIGEKLRVNVQLGAYTTAIGTEAGVLTLYHDGSDRGNTEAGDGVFTNHNTNIIVQVPYRIDL